MIIERPPLLYRRLLPMAVWRLPKLMMNGKKVVYLTFDDGPIPEVTPWVLSLLEEYGIHATFFCVADNVRKYPEVFQEVLAGGHAVGNHTYHHLQGIYTPTEAYVEDVVQADALIQSPLFRPPHGLMKLSQIKALQELGYTVVMQDLVTRDYSKWISPEQTLQNVMRYVREGSIMVFHDSLKSQKNLRYALPRAIAFLLEEGYCFEVIPGGRVLQNEEEGLIDSGVI